MQVLIQPHFLLIDCLSPIMQNKSPFEILFDKTPNYEFLKVFDCECFQFIRPYNKNKFVF
jgi:hypothetical protein